MNCLFEKWEVPIFNFDSDVFSDSFGVRIPLDKDGTPILTSASPSSIPTDKQSLIIEFYSQSKKRQNYDDDDEDDDDEDDDDEDDDNLDKDDVNDDGNNKDKEEHQDDGDKKPFEIGDWVKNVAILPLDKPPPIAFLHIIPSAVELLLIGPINQKVGRAIPSTVCKLGITGQRRSTKEKWIPESIKQLCIANCPSREQMRLKHHIPNTVDILFFDTSSAHHTISNTFKQPIHLRYINRRSGFYSGDQRKDESYSESDDAFYKNVFLLVNQDEDYYDDDDDDDNNSGDGENQDDSVEKYLGDVNVQRIDFLADVKYTKINSVYFCPSATDVRLGNYDQCLSTIQLPPQLKYLTAGVLYDEPIYQNNHLPITVTHLHLSIIINKDQMTNNWLSKKGFLPPSLTHIKFTIYSNQVEEEEEEEEEEEKEVEKEKGDDDEKGKEQTFQIPITILLPSTIKHVELNPDNEWNRSKIQIIDQKDYYSVTPSRPVLQDGLKELVLGKDFKHVIYPNILPSTLETLVIENPDYEQSIEFPSSLTSLSCHHSKPIDLSSNNSITKLKVYGENIVNYPPQLESLTLLEDHVDKNTNFNTNFNTSTLKELSIYSGWKILKKISWDKLTNLKNLSIMSENYQVIKVPQSVEVLDIRYCPSPFTMIETSTTSNNIKQIHLQISRKTINELSKPFKQQKIEKEINHLPMIDTFFKIWRNVFLKPRVLNSLYDLIPSTLQYSIKKGTLDQIDRFKNYNIFVGEKTHLQYISKFKPQAVRIRVGRDIKEKLVDVIPRSANKLRCDFYKSNPIPSWITDLSLDSWEGIEQGDIPNTVTKLSLYSSYSDDSYKELVGKIPSSVTRLTLNRLDRERNKIVPPSVTELTYINQPINDIRETDVPPTVKHIKLVNILSNEYMSYSIPPYISSRLLDGVFYIHSQRRDQVESDGEKNNKQHQQPTIPNNTTHLIWQDNEIIDQETTKIPSSVHTLVLGKDFNHAILSLPSSITQMVFNGEYTQPVDSICFPPSLKYLHFCSLEISGPINGDQLPNGLTHLTFSSDGYFTSIPASVSHFGFKGNGQNYYYPPTVLHIKVYSARRVVPIEPNMKSIVTSSRVPFLTPHKPRKQPEKEEETQLLHFNAATELHLHLYLKQIIMPYTLTGNVKSIRFNKDYNQPILKGSIPETVEYLEFGDKFNQKITREMLPSNLRVLKFGSYYSQEITQNTFPPSLTELVIKKKFENVVPTSLKKLTCPYFRGLFDQLPNSIHDIEFTDNFLDTTVFPIELVPSNITRLVLYQDMFVVDPSLVPPTIKSIVFVHEIGEGRLPSTLESLTLPESFNQPLYKILKTKD